MKILIIGSVASGKTSLAKRISKELNINYYEIDSIVHDDENNYKRTPEKQRKIINEINDKVNDWIIEGTLRKNLFYLLDMTDVIVYLNINVRIRKWRIIKRFVKQKLRLEKSNYKPSIEMLKLMFKWTNDFENQKEEFENKLLKYKEKLKIINNDKELNNLRIGDLYEENCT